MLNFDGSVYLFSGTVCLFLGVILLSVKRAGDEEASGYLRIRRFLAYCAFIDVLIDIFVIWFQIKNIDYFFLDYLFIPACYLSQLVLMTLAMLRVLYAPDSYGRKIRKMLIPVLLLILVYLLTYLYLAKQDAFSLSVYILHASGRTLGYMSLLLYILIFTIMFVCMYWLSVESRLFSNRINNFYSGKMLLDSRKLQQIVYAMIGYFSFAGIDFLLSDFIADSLFMLINTCIFVIGCIALLNLQKFHIGADPCFDSYTPDTIKHISMGKDQDQRLDRLIYEWAERSDKPYLKENLTLTVVASSMNVSPRLLSEYLNNILDQNFNTWINSLRVEEVKRLIREGSRDSLSDISYSAGFSDPAAMSKIFKKHEGLTPKEFRSNVR
ncbi:MAG: helix-turn-helix domain-containing protein [Bacteroidales bacterium]